MDVLRAIHKIATTKKINADGVPSASLAILQDGKIAALNITNGKEDTDTIYQACSISKAITAVAVAKLIDDGHFSYDTLVVQHLPQSTIDCIIDAKTAPLMQHVTVRMLVSHTSGLSQHGFPGYAGDVPSAEDILAGRAPSNTPRVHFLTYPGAQYSYSGGGFVVLQLFLEQVMKLPFADLMQNVVLGPLEMTRSRYSDTVLPPGEKNHAMAHYTAYVEANAPYHIFRELAAAGLWTTPSDLLRAVEAVQMSLHAPNGFLKQSTAKEMLTKVTSANTERALALGWASDGSGFGHTGSNEPGYMCYAFGSHGGLVNAKDDSVLQIPAGYAFAVMTSSSYGLDVIKPILSALLYVKGWPRVVSLPGHFMEDDFVPYPAVEGTPVEHGWQEWVGCWGDEWRLVEVDGVPRWSFKDFEAAALVPAAAPVKALRDRVTEHVFVVDGLESSVRLTKADGERVIELMQAERRVLKQTNAA
ncbi:hypothetical protein BAUCODRAFT_501946 [Baudoinia panamericana UAMH 10762]|uniref:Beta-lactamase-related domain-containing protein n=1 Tax=Baudoinia panamericana (strain UAMH 10762) TaxID=717646 RepID=M2NA45_BAUPA|nr:uncharacterized protein BAUCODRAFT_501946 [Baudoinia panamericana UAMH 10762]EMC95735.1 hypothetical protein BAUCODRAFT_501946 [Baudoinia panamericana UAMH 10762]